MSVGEAMERAIVGMMVLAGIVCAAVAVGLTMLVVHFGWVALVWIGGVCLLIVVGACIGAKL